MEVKQIKKLNSKKLRALLATVDERDCEKILNELALRGEPVALSELPRELSDDNPKKRYEEMKKDCGRIVRVRTMSNDAWTEGQVTAVTYDKVTALPYYKVRTVDGQVLYRSEKSNNIILTEQFRPLLKWKRGYTTEASAIKHTTREEAEKLRSEKMKDIGRYATVQIAPGVAHRCVLSSVHIKANGNLVMYKFSDQEVGGKPVYRSVKSGGIQFEDQYDEDIIMGVRKVKSRRIITDEDRLHVLESAFREAEARYARAKGEYESTKAEYEAFKESYLNK